MSFLRIRFQVAPEHSDRLSELLEDRGALAVTLENAGEDEFYEAVHPMPPTWRHLYATGLFAGDVDGAAVARMAESVASVTHVDTTGLADRDWERVGLADFHGFQAGPGLWVVPSWEDPPDPSAVHVSMDPGLAFGTGTHPTTALCLDWLSRQRLKGGTVIDYGCGSGILAIAALKLGADRAWGVDVDHNAVAASRRNAGRNGVGDRYTACLPEEFPGRPRGDIVIANILASVITDLAPQLCSLTAPSGTILLSGLLQTQETEVIDAFPPGLVFQRRRREQWSLLIGRFAKPAARARSA